MTAGWRMPHAPMVVALAVAALVGCAEGTSDLRQFVDKTKQRPGGRIEPIPEFEPYESFTYKPAELRDPFRPQRGFALSKEEQEQQEKDSKLARLVEQARNRPKEPLERFPLDSLEMVGTLSQGGRQWGLVKSPDDVIHRVREGNHVGQNYGEITVVSGKGIELVEIVPDGQGGWMRRQAALSLGEQ